MQTNHKVLEMQSSTAPTQECAPPTIFDRLCTAAYHALGIEAPPIDYQAWMIAAEAAWIATAGER